MDQRSERRLAENEVIFRTFNEEAKDFILEDAAHTPLANKRLRFYCECSDLTCVERIELSAEEYENLHRSNRRFVLKPGHEAPNVERVVQHHSDYVVVEKRIEPPTSADEIRPEDFV